MDKRETQNDEEDFLDELGCRAAEASWMMQSRPRSRFKTLTESQAWKS